MTNDDGEPLKVNTEGVFKYISHNAKTHTPESLLAELYGSMPGKIGEMEIKKIGGMLVVAGDDRGLSPEDINRLQEAFNNGNNGHSKWGIGCREAGTAAVQLVAEDGRTAHNKFYIIDNNGKGIRFTLKQNDNGEWTYPCFKLLNEEEVRELHKNYPTEIEKKFIVSKWIIPVSKKMESAKQNCINDIKKRFSKLLYEKKIEITFDDIPITVTQPFTCDNTVPVDSAGIYLATRIKNGKEHGKPFKLYKINGKYFKKDTTTEIKKEDFKIQTTFAEFGISYYLPSADNVNSRMIEFGHQHKDYNGLYVSNKGVLMSTENTYTKGATRGTGVSIDNHRITTIYTDTNKEILYTSNTKKNSSPILQQLLKDFLKTYNSLKQNEQREAVEETKENGDSNDEDSNDEDSNHEDSNDEDSDDEDSEEEGQNDTIQLVIDTKIADNNVGKEMLEREDDIQAVNDMERQHNTETQDVSDEEDIPENQIINDSVEENIPQNQVINELVEEDIPQNQLINDLVEKDIPELSKCISLLKGIEAQTELIKVSQYIKQAIEVCNKKIL